MSGAGVSQASLAQSLQQSLSANAQERNQAEQYLKSIESAAQFVVPLLQLVNSEATEPTVRFAAALYFKNFVKRRWAPSEDGEEAIGEADREAVKAELVGLMISAPKKLQLQLGEAVSIIAENDFPDKWPGLISSLVSKLSATDYHVNNGILQTAHTVFRGWRSAFRSDALYSKINHVLDEFTEPYMQVFVTTDRLLDEHKNDRAALKVLLHSLALLCQIYYDLNCQDLPPFFEDHMGEFMQTFHKYLVYYNPLARGEDDDVAGDLEDVKAGICEILELYAQRYEEDFKQLPQFVETVWGMLTSVGMKAKDDAVLSRGMGFLQTVVRNPRQKHLLVAGESLDLICSLIVLPNMVLPEADLELFEDDPMQYVRRDVEGSHAGGRREAAAGLVRGLLDQFPGETTQVMSMYIGQEVEDYAAHPVRCWRAKDVAMFMATSVAAVTSVQSLGVTQVNKLVDVGDFFATQVVQHLVAVDSDRETPILKASAIRYVVTFRNQLPRGQLAQTLPLLVAHLAHPSPAVSAYAAVAVERLLVLKRDGQLTFGPADVAPLAEAILGHAFGVLAHADSPQQLAENDFMMKLIMRTIVASRTDILRLAPVALDKLARIITEVSKNPSNPRFSHFMFEAVASLARFSCAADGAALGQFEATLFPIFQGILQADVAEFMPYVFQILAQLLGGHGAAGGLPEAYVQLLPPLLQPPLWAAQGNIPALVQLLQSYLQTGAAQLAAGGQLQPILGVFQRLIASRANDHHGFGLLLAVTQLVPADALQPYLRPILSLCLNRLQSSRTAKFTRGFAHYLGCVLCSPAVGPEVLIDTMEEIQPGMFAAVLQNVLLEAIPSVAGRVERKATVVGFARLLASPRFQGLPACAALTGPLLQQLAALLMESKTQATAAAAADADAEDLDSLEIEDTGYQASYARLATLGDARLDPCPQIGDAATGLGHVLRPVQASIAGAVQQLPADVCEFLSSAIAQAA